MYKIITGHNVASSVLSTYRCIGCVECRIDFCLNLSTARDTDSQKSTLLEELVAESKKVLNQFRKLI